MLITALGLLFDIFQVSLSVADVVTDILVCIEFRRDGHTAFFALVLTTLTITSIANGIIFGIRIGYLKSIRDGEEIKFLTFIPLCLVGLVLPPLNYVLTKCKVKMMSGAWTYDETATWNSVGEEIKVERMKNETSAAAAASPNAKENSINAPEESEDTNNNQGKGKDNKNNKRKKSKFASAAFKILQEKVESEHAVLGLLDRAVVERFMSFFLLNSMTLSESIPQIIVQLIAISIFEHVTTLQVISLTLSMFSVACKSFQLCRSFSVKAFFCKIFILAHDLFSMAFVFSVLLAVNTPRESTFFFLPEDHPAAFKINYMSNVWLMIKLINMGIWAVLGLWLWIFIYFEENFTHKKRDFFCASFLGLFVGCVVIGPALLVHEGVKLTWLIGFNFLFTPSPSDFPRCSIIHEFLHDADGQERYPTTDWRMSFGALLKKMKAIATHRERTFSWEKYKDMRSRVTNYQRDEASRKRRVESKEYQALSPKEKEDEDKSYAQVSWVRGPTPEEIRAAEYQSPFVSVSLARGVVVNRAALLQSCLRPFTRDSLRVDPRAPVDLLTPEEKKEDQEVLKEQQREQRRAEARANNNNDNNNDDEKESNNDEDEDDITKKLLQENLSPLLQSPSNSKGYGTTPTPTSINIYDNNDDSSAIIPKVRDDFVSRARHTLLVHYFFSRTEILRDRVLDYELPNTRAAKLHTQKTLGDWNVLTAQSSYLYDNYESRTVWDFVTDNSLGKWLRDFKEFILEDNIFKEPRPMMIFVTGITFFISSLVGLVFPIVYAALYWESFALMQKICWYSAMGSLFCALMLSKSFYNYQITCMFWEKRIRNMVGYFPTALLLQVIDSYFSLPLSTLQSAIFSAPDDNNKNSPQKQQQKRYIMPEDVFNENILPFLTTKQVGLYGVVDKNFVKVQEEILMNMS